MADNKAIAQEVLEAVGGPANVSKALHCMTRLRLNVKDRSLVDEAKVKDIDGVLGAQWSAGQYQVIIGQNVAKVYDEFVKLGVTAAGSVDENLDPNLPKEPLTLKKAGASIMNYLSKSMVSLIPVILAAAMFRTVGVIFGPSMLNLWAEDSVTYNLFYNWLYDAGFYFLPIYLGYTASSAIGVSPVMGMMMGGVLMAPELLSMAEAVASGGPATTTIYGFIPAPVADYSQTVLPILLCVAVMYPVEKFFKKVIPDSLSAIFTPWLTMVVMVPVGLCALAPIGNWLSQLIGTALFAFSGVGGFVALALIAACWEFLIMTGMHVVIVTLALSQMMTTGSDTCVLVAAGISVVATWAMGLGAFFRLKSPKAKGANLGYVFSGAIGGVVEPTLYGLGFKYPRTFIGMVVGGALGGVVAGLGHVTAYVAGASNILGIVGFLAGGTSNFVWAVVSYAVAFVVSAVCVYLFGFTKEDLDKDAASAAEELAAEGKVVAPKTA